MKDTQCISEELAEEKNKYQLNYNDILISMTGSNVNQFESALGLFTHDRELLKCEECQIYEDVTFEGVLITEFGDNYGKDTGLRFIETEESNIFICPKCGKRIEAEEEDLFDE